VFRRTKVDPVRRHSSGRSSHASSNRLLCLFNQEDLPVPVMSRLDFSRQLLGGRVPGCVREPLRDGPDIFTTIRGATADMPRVPEHLFECHQQSNTSHRSSGASAAAASFDAGDFVDAQETLLDCNLISHAFKDKAMSYERSLHHRSSPITIQSLSTSSGGLMISGKVGSDVGLGRRWYRNAKDVSLAASLSPTTSQWTNPEVNPRSPDGKFSPSTPSSCTDLNMTDERRSLSSDVPTKHSYDRSPPTSPLDLAMPDARLLEDSLDFISEAKAYTPSTSASTSWAENQRRRFLYDPVFSSPFELPLACSIGGSHGRPGAAGQQHASLGFSSSPHNSGGHHLSGLAPKVLARNQVEDAAQRQSSLLNANFPISDISTPPSTFMQLGLCSLANSSPYARTVELSGPQGTANKRRRTSSTGDRLTDHCARKLEQQSSSVDVKIEYFPVDSAAVDDPRHQCSPPISHLQVWITLFLVLYRCIWHALF